MIKNIISLIFTLSFMVSCYAESTKKVNPLLDRLLLSLDSLNLEDGQNLFLKISDNLIPDLNEYLSQANIKPDSLPEPDEIENNIDPILIFPQKLSPHYLKQNTAITYRYILPQDETTHTAQTSSSVFNLTNNLENRDEIPYNYKFSYTLDTIYFKDGSSKYIGHEIFAQSQVDDLKPVGIDSVSLSVNYEYPTQITLSENKQIIKLNDTTIILESLNQNKIQFRIEGLNSDSNITSIMKTKSGYYSDSNKQLIGSSIPIDSSKKLVLSIKLFLSEISDKIKSGKYNEKKDLISDVKQKINDIYFPETSLIKTMYISAIYKDNIDEMYLYFNNNKEKKRIQITIPVKENK